MKPTLEEELREFLKDYDQAARIKLTQKVYELVRKEVANGVGGQDLFQALNFARKIINAELEKEKIRQKEVQVGRKPGKGKATGRIDDSSHFGYKMTMGTPEKQLVWIGGCKKDLMALPVAVRRFFGHALDFSQRGEKHSAAKVMKGFGGAGVLEVVEDDVGGTYRAVYTVKFEEAVFVLHCFQKKSKSGIATPKDDLNIIRSRLKIAETLAKELRNDKTNR